MVVPVPQGRPCCPSGPGCIIGTSADRLIYTVSALARPYGEFSVQDARL